LRPQEDSLSCSRRFLGLHTILQGMWRLLRILFYLQPMGICYSNGNRCHRWDV
jgi:hypothetical protein